MSFVVIIPARFASTRFPGKPLIHLTGATGIRKTLVQRSWECAKSIPGCSDVWIATDDDRIAEEVRRFGGKAVMTSPDCANGTERCAEAAALLELETTCVVNLQGDAPLTPAGMVPALVNKLKDDPEAAMATPAVRCSAATLAHLRSDEAAGRVGGTTTVFDRNQRALYFSKRILPYLPPRSASDASGPVYQHIGIYAYRRESLQAYSEAEPSELEQIEGLEQLRFLHLGLKVSVLPLERLDRDPIELNNPSDLAPIEKEIARLGIA
jgi:3-deoxy-manno-octulosonate cytidylyltransferase (CMP-KDO synthetase)